MGIEELRKTSPRLQAHQLTFLPGNHPDEFATGNRRASPVYLTLLPDRFGLYACITITAYAS